MAITKEVLDELLKEYKGPEPVIKSKKTKK
jgi:hypothetical protein